jgi:formylglycine-generating enzyme required for sulfatase activity
MQAHAEYWLSAKRVRQRIARQLKANDRTTIECYVATRIAHFAALLEPEIRHGNGVAKCLARERSRLADEWLHIHQSANSEVPQPYIENSDGKHPDMVYIPAGECTIGHDLGFFAREEPLRRRYVEGFWIDVHPVTNAQYHALFHQHRPDFHSAEDDMPVVNVNWFDAHKFVAALGKRLVSPTEWEKAAKGPSNWLYSFGPEFDRTKAHIWPASGAARVRSHEPNPWGLYHMSGNVWEWTSELHRHVTVEGQSILFNLARGGSWRHCSAGARTSISLALDLAHRSENVGFRCASST